jgi:hypothetical protein
MWADSAVQDRLGHLDHVEGGEILEAAAEQRRAQAEMTLVFLAAQVIHRQQRLQQAEDLGARQRQFFGNFGRGEAALGAAEQ